MQGYSKRIPTILPSCHPPSRFLLIRDNLMLLGYTTTKLKNTPKRACILCKDTHSTHGYPSMDMLPLKAGSQSRLVRVHKLWSQWILRRCALWDLLAVQGMPIVGRNQLHHDCQPKVEHCTPRARVFYRPNDSNK